MVYVLGGWQSDFSANWNREGLDLADAFTQCVTQGLAATKLDAGEIESGHVGNFVGDLFCGQGLMGGFFGLVDPAFDGLPTARHEAACASGSIAILAAAAEIEAGRYDLSCVVGIEQMRNVSGQQAADNLAAAAWVGHEFQDARYVWPRAFSNVAEEYQRRYGLQHEHLMRIAEINFANAKRNPNAQTRGWQFSAESFQANDVANPVIEGLIRRQDCSQVSDGSAVVFLASPRRAAEYAKRHNIPLESLPRIKGWGHRSAPISYQAKIDASADQPYIFPQVRRAIEDARSRAGLSSIEQIDVVETHDCFTASEYMAIDHLGITAPGESWKAIEAGDIALGGRIPVNPSGGLIGLGHPVGATGVRMLLDAYKQVSGQAGEYQVEGAKNCQTLNIGGSTTTTVSFVVGV
ncbi:acetyl-CoA acetyltransferase [Pseudomonas sp. TTU2014-080ASC]|uniref:acetyl-CoA acetyltransferase n=1 Tax=Pseudomonas sp. TTU2014-080ASC TaxID=1729724 RepID=UPI0007184BD2|nr:acetyl-CoA acetyltransferase [Pseudomonas sp. TTU2014-080ASC]KRW58852.1 acetyl-CoA acetyltransferase [Pseudomonas sp. TTU2014-080ASC]